MLNKPISVALIFILISMFLTFEISVIVHNGIICYLANLISISLVSLYIGFSHARNLKEAIPYENQLKISAYYFLFWIFFYTALILLMVMNTTLKDRPLFDFNFNSGIALLEIFFVLFLSYAINSIAVYHALGWGSKLGLKKKESIQ